MVQKISSATRIVIKVGSSLIVDSETGLINYPWLESVMADVFNLWQQGMEIVIVSSGAIALGRKFLTPNLRTLSLEEKQAASAIGQINLAHAYQTLLKQYKLTAAQVLLTLEDSENRKRYINAKNTLENLLVARVIPIINENDTIATSEIRYGDNDRLAARVAQMITADTLVLLSDIEGLYTADPHLYPDAELIREVKTISSTVQAMAGESSSHYGSGGMITKLQAATIALGSGCRMVIAAGKHLHPLHRIDETEQKTWFIPTITAKSAKKNWLAHHLCPKGVITIDAGALHALQQGKSLLAVGVTAVKGNFLQGDPVVIQMEDKNEIGKGLINYSAGEMQKIYGKKSTLFETHIGYLGPDEVIHRDNLILRNA